jgi:hypothetical protein
MFATNANLEAPDETRAQFRLQPHIKPTRGQIKVEAGQSCIRSDAEERYVIVTPVGQTFLAIP